METIKRFFKALKLKDLFSPLIFVIILPISLIYRIILKIKHEHLWLINEHQNTARDNGYHFFKYVRINHPEYKCYYAINKKSNDFNKVKGMGNVIKFGGFRHWLYYMSSEYNISSQKGNNPSTLFWYFMHVILNLYNNRVFLQHGITVNNGKWLYYKKCRFKYFICGAKNEYEFIKKNFGYPKGNVVYTGFARFDNLNNNETNKKQVLIMPSWRNWLGGDINNSKIEFLDTEYYKNWNGLLSDDRFINYVENNNIEVLFYPHSNMQKFLGDFISKSKKIKIISLDYDIQKALRESYIMITDYSSVFMDFAYMIKPVLFFMFDYDEFRKRQYGQGYYDYKNGFGPAFFNKDELVTGFIEIFEKGESNVYIERMKNFFEIRDNRNCERIFKILSKEK